MKLIGWVYLNDWRVVGSGDVDRDDLLGAIGGFDREVISVIHASGEFIVGCV